MEPNNVCALCEYARMREDICGIYCVGEFWKREDGSCEHFLEFTSKEKPMLNGEHEMYKAGSKD